MNILIVNDDGIGKEGLNTLVKAASYFGQVYVAAPKYQQSAMSASITIKGPIEIEEITPIYGSRRTVVVTGTPVDTLRAGLKVFDQEFDLVLSGINHGPNLATDVHYSGTVAAAYEAAINQIPAIAFSAHDINLEYVYDETVKILDEIIESQVYKKAFVLNINYPHKSFKKVQGVKITKLGMRIQHIEYVKSDKPNIYNFSYSMINYKEDDDSDIEAFNQGYVSITPLKFDRTDFDAIKRMYQE